MPTIEDAARLALSLPGVTSGQRYGNRSWSVGGKVFAWERPFSKADLRRFGDVPPPEGPILALRVADLHDKEALLAENRGGFFTIPHFDGYAAVLLELDVVDMNQLREALTEAWLVDAPPEVATAYLGDADG